MNLLTITGDRSLAAGESGPLRWMLEEFRRYWERIDVICPFVGRPSDLHPFDNVYIHPAPGGPWSQPSHIERTAHGRHRERPLSLVVSHDYGLFRNAAGAFRVHHGLGIPWVSEIHHVDGYPRRNSLRGALRKALTRRHVRKSQSKVSAFRVVSKQIADLLVTWGVPSERIQVLGSLYLDLHELWPSTSKRDIDVLFCGRLEPEKGLGLLVDSLSYLQERRPGSKVVVLGRGSQANRFAAALRSRSLSGLVEQLSWIEKGNIGNLYRRSKVLLCTSYSEGNPRVVAEAMACGVCVVSTPVGRVPELIINGENGRVVDWDARLLAEAAAEFLEDESQRAKIASRAPLAVRGMDRASAIRKLANAYLEIAQASSKSGVYS